MGDVLIWLGVNAAFIYVIAVTITGSN